MPYTQKLNKIVDKTSIQKIFDEYYSLMAANTDKMFSVLFLIQWIIGILFAFFITPLTWTGETSQVHLHVYMAIIIGGLSAFYPMYLIKKNPGLVYNRYVVAISQIVFSMLFIHFTGGRIETHFHVFGSLAFLAFYRDWKILVVATLITATDHLVRGAFWPQSVYGVLSASPLRAFEHAAWVLFEDLFLLFSIKSNLQTLWDYAENQVKLERTVSFIEEEVEERTKQLKESQQTIFEQQQAIVTSSKMSALGEMAGGMAHEINNPLTIIKTMNSVLRKNLLGQIPTPTDNIDLTEKIDNTIQRIVKIVQGLRSFSRDAKKDPFQKVFVSNVIEETLSFCQERFKNKGIQVEIENQHSNLSFEGWSTEISQVLLNLLNNSYDSISDLTQKWIKISIQSTNNWIEMQVSDSGPRLSESIQQKLFQPFYTTKEVGKGTGMGLSISLGIVRNHQGELKYDPHCDHVKFIIRLPVKQESCPVVQTNGKG